LFRCRRGPGSRSTKGERHAQQESGGSKCRCEARIAQIEQMTLDQIAVFQCRILTDITTGRISPREASAIDRALRNRLKAIEQELREAG
jgi:hypothetical protein